MDVGTQPKSRVTLVTGGVRGLGLAVARRCAARGDRVHVAWRSSHAGAQELEREFTGRVHRADLALEREARDLVAAVIARDERLDVLVHTIGEFTTGPLAECSSADLERMLASNVTTAFQAFNAARTALRAAGGNALFFGCAGLNGSSAKREAAAYTAAKSALLVLVRSWALEEAKLGVRVNMLSPGIVPHEHSASETHDPQLIARIPMGRAATPDEIADAALFLTSDSARYITGAELPVAGGWLL